MPERRASPRIELSVACTLRRRSGSAIEARTVDLGPGGMSVKTGRPLAADEVVHFNVPLSPDEVLDGQARVLREQTYRVYALRFEGSMAHSRSSSA
ncbi:MAG: PilZ domain-containing protein [Solirubrobacteraceae bacterium]